MKKLLIVSAAFSLFAWAAVSSVYAQVENGLPTNNSYTGGNPSSDQIKEDKGVGSGDPVSDRFQIVSCDGVQKYMRNPQTGAILYNADGTPQLDGNSKECNYEQLIFTVRRIIQLAIYALTPIVIGMLLFTGYKYMTAGGDVNMIADAKRMFRPILLGLVLIFGAWITVYTVLDKIIGSVQKIGDIKKENIIPKEIKK